MFFPVKMRRLSVIAPAEKADGITRVLLDAGSVDFSEPKDFARWDGVRKREVAVSQDRVREIRTRIEGFLSMGDDSFREALLLDADAMEPLDPEQCDKILDRLAGELQAVREKQKILQQELFRREELREQLERLPKMALDLPSEEGVYIRVHTGVLKKIHKEAFLKALKNLNTMCRWEEQDQENVFLILVALKREQKPLEQLLERFHWISRPIPAEAGASSASLLAEMNRRIDEAHEEQKQLAARIKEIIGKRKEELLTLWRNVRVNELYDQVQLEFGETRRTILFSGWVPEKASRKVEEQLRGVAGKSLYLEWQEVRDLKDLSPEEVPVELSNPGFLQPFQLLVENYSLPSYGTVDPTPFTALSFFLMFGLMFGDAGQGAVILLGGLLGRRFLRKNPDRRRLASLIAWCGLSAVLFGVLFGSYFGFPLLPALWFDYHGIVVGHGGGNAYISSIYDILGLTIRFGIVLIYTGLVLNWVNLARRKEWIDLVLGRTGLLGGWIYGAGIYASWIFTASGYRTLPSSSLLGGILGIPVLLLFLKEPLEALHHKKPFKAPMPADFFMEGLVQVLETFSGYLSNTLSFMRVAGLGIAHVSLMTAFAEMAGLTDSLLFRFLILAAGNILVIALEGLSAGIQSLRLNYYEFFSKYFTGSGRAFAPVSLGRRKAMED